MKAVLLNFKFNFMDLSTLPKPGPDFKMIDLNGFKEKFWELTRWGKYQVLQSNREAILREIQQHEDLIRRGGLDSSARIRICNEIRHLDPKLTNDDMNRLKEILQYLSHY
jgi:hypothetical protein